MDKWIVYGTVDGKQLFSACELTVLPGRSITIKDPGAYGLIVVQGSGTIGALDVDSPNFIRFGEVTKDEVFVTAKRAGEGVSFKNTGSEPFVSLRYFGPDTHASFPPWATTARHETGDSSQGDPGRTNRQGKRRRQRLMYDASWEDSDEFVDRLGERLLGRIKAELDPTEYLLWADRPAVPPAVRIPFVPALFVSVVAGLSGFSLAAMFGLVGQAWMDLRTLILAFGLGSAGPGRDDRRPSDQPG